MRKACTVSGTSCTRNICAPCVTAVSYTHLDVYKRQIVYCAGVSWVLLKITDLLVGLRVTKEEEREGLDIVLHGEQLF